MGGLHERYYHSNGEECTLIACPELHRVERLVGAHSHPDQPDRRSIVDLAIDTRSAHEQRSGVERRADAEYNHPQHYGGADNPYEAIKVIMAWGLGFNLGNTVKYISRAGKKDPAKTIEDLKKARWYLDYEIARLDEAGAAAAHDIGG